MVVPADRLWLLAFRRAAGIAPNRTRRTALVAELGAHEVDILGNLVVVTNGQCLLADNIASLEKADTPL